MRMMTPSLAGYSDFIPFMLLRCSRCKLVFVFGEFMASYMKKTHRECHL